jgi:hypothetical protein
MLWQLIGFFTYFEFSHYYVKKEIKGALKRTIPEDQRKLFYFTLDQEKSLEWIKSNEFKLNGRYYDVIERTVSNGKVKLACIDDIQETQLFNRLSVRVASSISKGEGKIPISSWFQLLQQPFILVPNLTVSTSFAFIEKERLINPKKINNYEVYLAIIPSPPKRLV